MPAEPLSMLEREQISRMIVLDLSITRIAFELDRCRSTISREVNRNGGRDAYSAVMAQDRAREKRCRAKVPILVQDRVLAGHVRRRLKAKDSPKTISIELARGVWGIRARVSHETIYRAIYAPGSAIGTNARTPHLRRRQRKCRGQRDPGGHSLGNFRPIRDRCQSAADRAELGHLEGDLIAGKLNQSALITINDRLTRLVWIQATKSKKADDVFEALLKLFRRIPPPLRKTLTWDQGSEMARWPELADRLNIGIYIADPKSPWQRPTNENSNAHVRRYVGKGTNLNLISTRRLRHIETRLNTIPRRSLNWRTSNDIYNQHVAMTS